MYSATVKNNWKVKDYMLLFVIGIYRDTCGNALHLSAGSTFLFIFLIFLLALKLHWFVLKFNEQSQRIH